MNLPIHRTWTVRASHEQIAKEEVSRLASIEKLIVVKWGSIKLLENHRWYRVGCWCE